MGEGDLTGIELGLQPRDRVARGGREQARTSRHGGGCTAQRRRCTEQRHEQRDAHREGAKRALQSGRHRTGYGATARA